MDKAVNNLISLIKKDLDRMDKNKSIRLKPKKYVDNFISSYLNYENMMRFSSFINIDYTEFLSKEIVEKDLNELLNEMETLLNFKINSYKSFLITLFNKLIYNIKSNKLVITFNKFEEEYPNEDLNYKSSFKFLLNATYGASSNFFYNYDKNIVKMLIELEVFNTLLLTLYNYMEKNYEDLLEIANVNDYFDIVMYDRVKKVTNNKLLMKTIMQFTSQISPLDFDGDILNLRKVK